MSNYPPSLQALFTALRAHEEGGSYADALSVVESWARALVELRDKRLLEELYEKSLAGVGSDPLVEELLEVIG